MEDSLRLLYVEYLLMHRVQILMHRVVERRILIDISADKIGSSRAIKQLADL